MAKTYNRLDIEINKDILPIITAVQDDIYSRYLDVNLFENGVAIDLTAHKVRIYIKKKDGTELFNIGQITDAVNGRVQFELTTQTLAVCGELRCQIIIFNNEETQVLSTNIFKIFVTQSLKSDNAIESSNEYGALVVLFQNIYEALQLMTDMVHKIGEPGEISNELDLNTMFEVWEYLLNFVIENIVKETSEYAIENKINELLKIIQKVAKETSEYAIENKVKELLSKIQSFETNLTEKIKDVARETSEYAIENKIDALKDLSQEINKNITQNRVVKSIQRISGVLRNSGTTQSISSVDINKTIVLSNGYMHSYDGVSGGYITYSCIISAILQSEQSIRISYYGNPKSYNSPDISYDVQIVEFY